MKINEVDSVMPKSEEVKEEDEEDAKEVVEIKEVRVNEGDSEKTPRKKGRCSPGAVDRSRRRLLEFQARLDPVLGLSRLQIHLRALTSPITPIPRMHQGWATNLLVEFEKLGAEADARREVEGNKRGGGWWIGCANIRKKIQNLGKQI